MADWPYAVSNTDGRQEYKGLRAPVVRGRGIDVVPADFGHRSRSKRH